MSQIDRISPSPAPSPGSSPVQPPQADRRSWFGRHKVLTFLLFLLLVVPLFPAGVVVGQSGKADAIVNRAKKLAGMTVTPSAAPSTAPGVAAGEPAPGAFASGPATDQSSAPGTGAAGAPAKVYSGTGDSIVKITKPATGTVLFTLRHDTNSAIEVYSVESDTGIVLHYDTAYRGTVPLDTSSTETRTVRIKTTGPWKFSLAAPAAAPAFDASVKGTGDEVLRYTGAGGTLTAANKGKSNFQVDARWDQDSANLVNEIGDYTGQEIMPAGPKLVVVHSDGTWKLTVTP